jgi:hypothetical protein
MFGDNDFLLIILLLFIARDILDPLFLPFLIPIYPKKCKKSEESEEKVGD